MLEKTMLQIINKKVNHWLETIDCEETLEVIKKNLIITGGCFTSMILNETPNDYDCYFRTKEATLKVAQYYADKWNEAHEGQTNKLGYECKVFVLDGENPSKEILDYYKISKLEESSAVSISSCPPERVKMIFPSDGYTGDPDIIKSPEDPDINMDDMYLAPTEVVEELDEIKSEEILKKEKKPYFPVFITSNAISLSDGIQLVIRFYGEPGDIHETYDFEHTKAYYDYGKNELVIPKDVYELVINKTLKYTGSLYPVCSVFRVRKFIQRGWTINAGQLLKMCLQISELNLMNISVLEDQLIGVDSLYFMALIKQFKERQKSDPNFELSSAYVISIVDKIF